MRLSSPAGLSPNHEFNHWHSICWSWQNFSSWMFMGISSRSTMYVYSFNILVWYISSHIILKTRNPELYTLVIAINFLRWTALTLHIQFLPGALHSRLLINRLLISSKLIMVIIYFLILVWSYILLLQANISSLGSEFVMLGSCAWQMSHLLPCQISIGARFFQLTTLYRRRRKPR